MPADRESRHAKTRIRTEAIPAQHARQRPKPLPWPVTQHRRLRQADTENRLMAANLVARTLRAVNAPGMLA